MMHDEVVSRLRHLLTEGEIPPGARIPERELCASLSISRTPLREALKVLAAEGLVMLLPNRGSRAAKLTQKDVKDLFEVCEALQATAGELACPRISDQQLHEIAALQANMVEHYRARDLLSYYRCNRLIHESIVRAADNAVLAGLYESISARIRRARFITPYPADPSSTQTRGSRAGRFCGAERFSKLNRRDQGFRRVLISQSLDTGLACRICDRSKYPPYSRELAASEWQISKPV